MIDPGEKSPGPIIELGTQEGYDRWAAVYDTDGNPLIALEDCYLPGLIGDVHGLAVADIGCGTGRHALRLAAHGAKVVALDFSIGMLCEAAKQQSRGVQFVRADLEKPLPLAQRRFDRLICCLVLDHISGVAQLFSEMKRACRLGGSIVISAMHPAMMLRGVQAQFHDATGMTFRPRSVPNQISDYVSAVIAAGLRLEHISEHSVDEELAATAPRARKYLGWPMLLLMRLGVN